MIKHKISVQCSGVVTFRNSYVNVQNIQSINTSGTGYHKRIKITQGGNTFFCD